MTYELGTKMQLIPMKIEYWTLYQLKKKTISINNTFRFTGKYLLMLKRWENIMHHFGSALGYSPLSVCVIVPLILNFII